MNSTPKEEIRRVKGSLRIFNQNIAKQRLHLDVLLDNHSSTYDILFIQEPPWATVRLAPSTSNVEGDPMIGAPNHPEWIQMVRLPSSTEESERPRTMAYVHKRCVHLQPSLRRDVVDHHDVLVMSIFNHGKELFFANVYLDDEHMAINLLYDRRDSLPAFEYMGGDFNCHSKEWDIYYDTYPVTAQCLLMTAEDLGLHLTLPDGGGPTHIPHDFSKTPTVIDLIFQLISGASAAPKILQSLQETSDHLPLGSEVQIRPEDLANLKQSFPVGLDDDEMSTQDYFIIDVQESMTALSELPLTNAEEVNSLVSRLQDAISEAWHRHTEEKHITARSKPWWIKECSAKLKAHQVLSDNSGWKAFRLACS